MTNNTISLPPIHDDASASGFDAEQLRLIQVAVFFYLARLPHGVPGLVYRVMDDLAAKGWRGLPSSYEFAATLAPALGCSVARYTTEPEHWLITTADHPRPYYFIQLGQTIYVEFLAQIVATAAGMTVFVPLYGPSKGLKIDLARSHSDTEPATGCIGLPVYCEGPLSNTVQAIRMRRDSAQLHGLVTF